MKKKMEEMDVATQVKILVPRNSGLVGHLLYNPVAAIRNRRLLSMQNSNVSNVHNYTRTSMGHFGASTSGMTSVPASTLDHCNSIFLYRITSELFFSKTQILTFLFEQFILFASHCNERGK